MIEMPDIIYPLALFTWKFGPPLIPKYMPVVLLLLWTFLPNNIFVLLHIKACTLLSPNHYYLLLNNLYFLFFLKTRLIFSLTLDTCLLFFTSSSIWRYAWSSFSIFSLIYLVIKKSHSAFRLFFSSMHKFSSSLWHKVTSSSVLSLSSS